MITMIISVQQVIKGRGKLFVGVKLETMQYNAAPQNRVVGCFQLRLGRIVNWYIQWQDKDLADLAITTDLNLLVVVQWVYQMMNLLEWNNSSVE